jgi:tetratricopeptide (TPR) repeat protein
MPRYVLSGSVLFVALCASSCSTCRREQGPSDEAYREAVTAFHTGVAAMQTTQEVLARSKFDRVIELVPQEPAGWANLGLLLLRQQEIEQGAQRLARAAELAPDSPAIQRLQALAESRRGNLAQAIRHWRRALDLDPNDLEAAYALALETERQGGAAADAEAQQILAKLLERRENLAARIEYVRLAAKRGDATALKTATAPLTAASRSWSPQAREQLTLMLAAAAENPRAAATRVAFLKNFLLREPIYRAALAEVSTPREEVGQPVVQFLRLENPAPQPAPADESLAFTVEAVSGSPVSRVDPALWVGTVSLTGEGSPIVAAAGPSGLQMPGVPDGGSGLAAGSWPLRAAAGAVAAPDAVAVADFNDDFRTDLALAGEGGIRILRQGSDGRFADVTESTKLPATIRNRPAHGLWPADVDTDGDLDLVLAPRDGQPVVVRNNGDGTFATREPFADVTRVRGFTWADLDGEGVPDAVFLDANGVCHAYVNLRGGIFRKEQLLSASGRAAALAVAELTGDSVFDLLVLGTDGALSRLSRSTTIGTWQTAPVARIDPLAGLEPGTARLLTADLDNNGAIDVIAAGATGSRILLGGPGDKLIPLPAILGLGVQAAGDVDGNGRLELVGLLDGGRPGRAIGKGAKSYHWQVLHPRAATATGDQRINSFGIGGEVEVRSGLHAQKQPIASPLVHFGLGNAARAEIVRITWPNGALQSEFETKADDTFKATQRLKGSCPWLFAWNGREMAFVTDVIWRSPLGLRINAQETADVLMTEDRVKIRGDQLAVGGDAYERGYDLRITAELWETHFFDLLSLLVVDHPEGTEIFVDERFVVPPPDLDVIVTGPVLPMASVRNDRGGDESELARARDSRHVDFAGRGPYQGVTRDHFVELELPAEAPRSGPLWLVAQGWVHPTDSSINVAMGQGSHQPPQGLSLHVADQGGRFREARTKLGFPAGKDKTILLDLSGLFPAAGPRRVRLATNLEIFWDWLGWAVGRPEVRVQPRRLELSRADLSYRGYSVVEQPAPSVPERPRYVLAGTGQLWRDLEGYYTRFGDVRELVERVDDRYVIMNAGDELRLRFPEAPPPARGLVRDFVFVGDGWVKDGDYNTSSSRTVLPLPTHGQAGGRGRPGGRAARYDTPPGQLEDDSVYRQHPRDFAEYHTRYVTPDRVRDALRVHTGLNRR